jgi:hypothetical protein
MVKSLSTSPGTGLSAARFIAAPISSRPTGHRVPKCRRPGTVLISPPPTPSYMPTTNLLRPALTPAHHRSAGETLGRSESAHVSPASSIGPPFGVSATRTLTSNTCSSAVPNRRMRRTPGCWRGRTAQRRHRPCTGEADCLMGCEESSHEADTPSVVQQLLRRLPDHGTKAQDQVPGVAAGTAGAEEAEFLASRSKSPDHPFWGDVCRVWRDLAQSHARTNEMPPAPEAAVIDQHLLEHSLPVRRGSETGWISRARAS